VHSDVPLNLGQALRAQTRQLHTQVERSGVMQELLHGRIDRAAYCALLRNLHVIYAALEAGLARHAGHPYIAFVTMAGLARGGPLADDLAVLHGPGWASAYPALPATQRYAARLLALDARNPELLLAHAYVRYLGDLSGGQMLRRIIARTFALEGSSGTQFYVFGDNDGAARMAQRFREGLDAVAVDADGIAALVVEAQWGFAVHGQLFEELLAASSC
jgi:heme oxygenase